PTRLSQALANLLNNAAKFTPDGGAITLAAHREGDTLEVAIRDTGIGIAPEMLPRIFDLFTQVDSTAGRSQGGLGIGLTLVRPLVEMHGGTVEAHSAGPGQGSEFVVRLPALANTAEWNAEEPPPDRRASAVDKSAVRRFLVVDDNADSRESLMEV